MLYLNFSYLNFDLGTPPRVPRTQMTTEGVIWTFTTFSTHLGLLEHSTGLLALSQGLQELRTWAWTKSKRPPLTLTLTQPTKAPQGAPRHINIHLLASMTS